MSRYFLGFLLLAVGCTSTSDGVSAHDDALVSVDATETSTAAPVYLNHTFGMFSQGTIDAIQASPYLKDELVDVEVRTTVSPGMTYTGTYFNTRDTYFELFPEGTFGSTHEAFGIALGDEATSGLENVLSRWNAELTDGTDPIELRSHEVNGTQVPWFRLGWPVWTNSSQFTSLWAMEYVPNPGATTPRSRREERAARYQPTKLAQNVHSVTYAVIDTERELIRRTLKSVGWKITPTAGDAFVAIAPHRGDSGLDGGGSPVILSFLPARADGQGLREITWKLNRRPAFHHEQLGDFVLNVGRFNQAFASMTFHPATSTTSTTEDPQP